MAKHKSATEVTVASLTESGLFQQLVSKYWLPATIAVVALSALILFQKHQADSARRDLMARWSGFAELVRVDPMTGYPTGDPAALAAAAEKEQGTLAGGFLRLVEAIERREDGDWRGAEQAAEAIQANFSDVGVLNDPLEGGAALADRLKVTAAEAASWESQHEDLFENPPLPEGSPRVRIKTTAGDLVVGLYSDRAPQHCENFLKLCGEGFYDSTRFHRVGTGFMIQGGDPNTKEGEPSTWGLGGPGYKIDPEPNGLLHFEGALAAAKLPQDKESSGSQFYITVADRHELDGGYVVFGKVLDGLEVATELSEAPVSEGTERPLEPAVILGTEVL